MHFLNSFKTITLSACLGIMGTLEAQENPDYSVDVNLAIGNINNIQAQFRKNFYILNSKKLMISPGLRFGNSFTSSAVDYISAPPEITSKPEFIDTVSFNKSNIYNVNLGINFAYQVNKKISIRFDIDLIGVSFGEEQSGTYRSGEATTINNQIIRPVTGATATSPNLLLVADNDEGTLSSAFTINYSITDHFAAKIGLGYLFTEYTSPNTFGASNNDSWRAKTGQILVGGTYNF